MSETIITSKGADKAVVYEELLPQIQNLLDQEPNLIANLANVSAVLKEVFHFFWVGFYLVEEDELVLGPFQGPLACTRIRKGKGVCGKAWEDAIPILVPDVELFPGHIACSSQSRSEVVVPIFKGNEVVAILDVDSDQLDSFDAIDVQYLTKIVHQIGRII